MQQKQNVLVEKRSEPSYKTVTLSDSCEPGNQLYRGVGLSYRVAYEEAYRNLRMGMDTITASRLQGLLERGDLLPDTLRQKCSRGLKMWFALQSERQPDSQESRCPCCRGEGEVATGYWTDGEPKILDCPVCGDEDLDSSYDEAKEEGHIHVH